MELIPKGRGKSPKPVSAGSEAPESMSVCIQIGVAWTLSRKNLAIYLVEVEGDAAKQREQAMYSALGQLLLLMEQPMGARFCLAVPDTREWRAQRAKVPRRVVELLSLEFFLVSTESVATFAKTNRKAV